MSMIREYMSDVAVSVESVSKSFGGTPVLSDVSVDFGRGKIHGVIGRNGSGKTVLFKCICGLLPYDTGTIKVEGSFIGKNREMPEDCGIMIENPGFLPNYSGYKNLRFLADLSGRATKQEVRDAIFLVGLDAGSRKHVKKYSLGMKQRLAIAQAIMEDPSLFILDEPLSGLDKKGLVEMRALFLDYRNRGKTIIVASHSAEDIDTLCDSVHEIDGGKLTKVR